MRVMVMNIPVNSFVSGVVTVPDGTLPEKLQDAIRKALLEDGYVPLGGSNADPELDTGILLGGWEFDFFTEWRL